MLLLFEMLAVRIKAFADKPIIIDGVASFIAHHYLDSTRSCPTLLEGCAAWSTLAVDLCLQACTLDLVCRGLSPRGGCFVQSCMGNDYADMLL